MEHTVSTTPTAIPANSFPDKDQDGPLRESPESRRRIGWVVAG
jgi:hypothetical protein